MLSHAEQKLFQVQNPFNLNLLFFRSPKLCLNLPTSVMVSLSLDADHSNLKTQLSTLSRPDNPRGQSSEKLKNGKKGKKSIVSKNYSVCLFSYCVSGVSLSLFCASFSLFFFLLKKKKRVKNLKSIYKPQIRVIAPEILREFHERRAFLKPKTKKMFLQTSKR